MKHGEYNIYHFPPMHGKYLPTSAKNCIMALGQRTLQGVELHRSKATSVYSPHERLRWLECFHLDHICVYGHATVYSSIVLTHSHPPLSFSFHKLTLLSPVLMAKTLPLKLQLTRHATASTFRTVDFHSPTFISQRLHNYARDSTYEDLTKSRCAPSYPDSPTQCMT